MRGPKKTLSLLLKLAFSLTILTFILTTQTSFREIGAVLREVRLPWLALAFSLHAFGLYASAYRWQILAGAQGDEIPMSYLAKSYLVGQFFNIFLPTRFGGDIVRIFDGSRYSRSLVKSSAIVMVERSTGIIVLFLFAALAALFRLDMARHVPVVWAALLIGIFGLGLVVVFFLPPATRWLSLLPGGGWMGKLKAKIIAFRETVLFYRTQKGPFLRASLWALLLQLNVICHYYLIGRALRLHIPFLDYFMFIPIVLLIQIIPITINGLGLREGSYIEIFKFYGIPAQAAVSFSFIEIAFGLIIGIIGGIIYVARK